MITEGRDERQYARITTQRVARSVPGAIQDSQTLSHVPAVGPTHGLLVLTLNHLLYSLVLKGFMWSSRLSAL